VTIKFSAIISRGESLLGELGSIVVLFLALDTPLFSY